MNLIRKFEDYILYSPIFESAFQRRKAMDKIRGISFILFFHILKVKLLKDGSISHWKNEIFTFILDIYDLRIKPNSKKFNKEDYIEWLFVEPFCDGKSSAYKGIFNVREDYIESVENSIKLKYNVEVKITNEIIEECKNIIFELSEYISDNKIVKIKELIDKI